MMLSVQEDSITTHPWYFTLPCSETSDILGSMSAMLPGMQQPYLETQHELHKAAEDFAWGGGYFFFYLLPYYFMKILLRFNSSGTGLDPSYWDS